MSALLELAERCEKATRPNYDLEVDIAFGIAGQKRPPKNDIYMRVAPPPNYTASLDAAMKLIPENALWKAQHTLNIGDGETFERPKGEPATDFQAGVGIGNVPMHWEYGRSFVSASLALCAAALRARAAGDAA